MFYHSVDEDQSYLQLVTGYGGRGSVLGKYEGC